MSAIIDSNVSTVLTAAVLFQFGTGPVKGFAVTLHRRHRGLDDQRRSSSLAPSS